MNKYLGCLLGAAAGDALGAPTETRNPEQIRQFFHGPVTTFVAPPNDVFARGNKAGQVTDDFSLAYVTLESILERNELSNEVAIDSLIKWANNPNYVRLAGPTTLARIQSLQTSTTTATTEFVIASDNAKATNGLAMKIAPIALLSHGDIEKAITITLTIGQVTHNNNIALAAGAAVAAATAKALQPESTLDQIIESAIKAAQSIETRAISIGASDLAGSSVSRRIKHALQVVQQAPSVEQAQQDLIDFIGTGILAYESVPTAFGLLYLYPNKPIEAILAAVNIGNDTDTIATIVGGILGALHGDAVFPQDYLSIINEANGYDLALMAERIQQWRN